MTELSFGWDKETKEKYWEINGERVSQEKFEDFAIQEGVLPEK